MITPIRRLKFKNETSKRLADPIMIFRIINIRIHSAFIFKNKKKIIKTANNGMNNKEVFDTYFCENTFIIKTARAIPAKIIPVFLSIVHKLQLFFVQSNPMTDLSFAFDMHFYPFVW